MRGVPACRQAGPGSFIRIKLLKQSFEFLFFSFRIKDKYLEYHERGSAKEVGRVKDFELEGVLNKSNYGKGGYYAKQEVSGIRVVSIGFGIINLFGCRSAEAIAVDREGHIEFHSSLHP